MINSDLVKDKLSELQYLAAVQRIVRTGLRAFWLGSTGILLGWSVNTLWGWLPDPKSWVLLGLVFGLLPMLAFLRSLRSHSQWLWMLDRRLGLQEQFSTAWDVIHTREGGLVSEALAKDVLAILPMVRRRMLKYGWFLERDLLAVSILLLLSIMVLSANLIKSYPGLIEVDPVAAAPPVDEFQPQEEQSQAQPPVQPESQDNPSVQPGPAPQESPGADTGQAGGENPDLSNVDPGALADALNELGADLRNQAATFDLGEALQEMDLNEAAGDLENLADQLEDLSPETRERLAEAMREAAEAVEEAGAEPLAEDLREAAGALQEQDPGGASDEMDQLAQDLRDLAAAMQESQAAGGGAGNGVSGETGMPESANRLEGEGGDMQLPLEDASESGILSPALPDAGGEGTVSGSLDSTTAAGDDVVQSPLVPNTFLWKWRDVVSSYFKR